MQYMMQYIDISTYRFITIEL